jgi:hypothetical protein
MKNISTGTGIALLAGAIVAYPIIDRVMPRAEAGATHVSAFVAASTAQDPPEPAIVWYGLSTAPSGSYNPRGPVLFRAWSDGKIEMCRVDASGFSNWCSQDSSGAPCRSAWYVVSYPAQGLTYRSDINFDSKVDGADLGTLLADWGDAPLRATTFRRRTAR